jgi:hypothetical protein
VVADAAASAAAAPTTAPSTETRIYKFTSARRLNVNGRDHLVVIATFPSGGASLRLVVPNADVDRYSPKKQIADAFGGMQAGSYVQVETKKVDGTMEIQSVGGWSPRAGEDTPHGYIYINSSPTDRPGELKVALTKLGEWVYPIVPAEKDDNGSPAPAALLAAELKAVQQGDVVWADLTPGKQPVLASIVTWSEPQQGKLERVGPADVDGQRGYAVEIATESKPVTALIPLRLQNGKRVTDQKLLAAAHKPSNGSQVFFRTFEEGGNTWLIEIEPPPRHPSAPVAQQRREGNPPPAGIPTHTVGGAGSVPGVGGIPGGF